MEQIKFVINKKTGSVKVEANGFTGTRCLEATKKFEESLGTKSEVIEKPEMFQEQHNEQKEYQQ